MTAAPGCDGPHVLVGGLRVHADQDADVAPAGDEALPGGPDREPGRQPLDVGRKEVLARDRDAHLEDGPHQDVVRGHAARPVGRGDVDREVVDDGAAARLAAVSLSSRTAVDIVLLCPVATRPGPEMIPNADWPGSRPPCVESPRRYRCDVSGRALAAAARASCLAAPAARASAPSASTSSRGSSAWAAFALSPDGKWLAYAVATPDVEENRTRSAIWIKPAGRRRRPPPDLRPVPRHRAEVSRPTAAGWRFSRTARADSQVWTLDLAGGEPRRPTAFATDIDGFAGPPTGSGSSSRRTSFPTAPTRRARRGASRSGRSRRSRRASPSGCSTGTGTPGRTACARTSGRCPVARTAARGGPDTGRPRRAALRAETTTSRSRRTAGSCVFASNPDTVEALSTNVGRVGRLLRRFGHRRAT